MYDDETLYPLGNNRIEKRNHVYSFVHINKTNVIISNQSDQIKVKKKTLADLINTSVIFK